MYRKIFTKCFPGENSMKYFIIAAMMICYCSASFGQTDFAVGLTGGIKIPVGQFNEFYGAGYGGTAQLLYNVSSDFLVMVSVGYNRWNVDENAVNNKANEENLNARFELDSHFRTIPFFIGVRYYLAHGKNRPFFSLKFGGYSYEFKLAGTIVNTVGTDIPKIPIPDTKYTGTESALSIGFGYLHKISKHLYFELNSKYNIMTNAFSINKPDEIYNPDKPTSIYGVKGTLNFISISAGINFRI